MHTLDRRLMELEAGLDPSLEMGGWAGEWGGSGAEFPIYDEVGHGYEMEASNRRRRTVPRMPTYLFESGTEGEPGVDAPDDAGGSEEPAAGGAGGSAPVGFGDGSPADGDAPLWQAVDGNVLHLPPHVLARLVMMLRGGGGPGSRRWPRPGRRVRVPPPVRSAVKRRVGRIARGARRIGVLRSRRSGRRFPVFAARMGGRNFRIVTRPRGGRRFEIQLIHEVRSRRSAHKATTTTI